MQLITPVDERNQQAHSTTPEGENPYKYAANIYPLLYPKLRIPAGPHRDIQLLRRQAGTQKMSPYMSGTTEFPSCWEHDGNCSCCEHEAEPGDHVAAQTSVGVRVLMPRIRGPPGESCTNHQYYPTKGKRHVTQGEHTSLGPERGNTTIVRLVVKVDKSFINTCIAQPKYLRKAAAHARPAPKAY